MRPVVGVLVMFVLCLSALTLAQDPGAPVPAAAAPAAPTAAAAPTDAAVPAPATDVAPDPVGQDPAGFIDSIIQAAHDKNWSYVVGAVLMLLVWVVRRFFWTTIPTAVIPWLAAGLGVVTDISLSLSTGVIWWKALLSGLTSGAAAIALWELVFKHFLGDKKDKPADKPA